MTVRRVLLLGVVMTACQEPLGPAAVLPPPCRQPAPLDGTYTPAAPGYLVMFRPGTDATQEVQRLTARYDFAADAVWTSVGGFLSSDLTPSVVARLRCEAAVLLISRDAIGYTLGDQAAARPPRYVEGHGTDPR